jgi:chromate transporter
VVAAGATFLPCFLLTVIPAPYFHRYGSRPALKAVVAGITAAAVGAIAGAVVVLARQTIRDLPTALIALAALVITLTWRKVPEPLIVIAAALLGLALHSARA